MVSSSSLVGELLGSSWHLRHHPYVQYTRDWSIAVRLGCLVIILTFLVANKLVPFDSKQCSQAPLNTEHQSSVPGLMQLVNYRDLLALD